MGFLKLYMLFIAISFFASLRIYFTKKTSYNYLKLFPPLLLVTLIVELLGAYLGSQGKNNLALYNFFSVFWICYCLGIINCVITNTRVKKIMWGTIVLYTLAAIINILFIQKVKTFNTVTYSFGFLLIVLFCIYYFFELFSLPKSVHLANNPAFWICLGLLFFCCCGFPLYGFINYWAKVPLVIQNFNIIVTVLNIFLYSLFTIAFLCAKTPKYTLSQS